MSTTVDLPGSPRSGVWWSGGLEFAPPLTCAEVQTFAVGWVQIKFSWQEQVVRRAGTSSVGLALGTREERSSSVLPCHGAEDSLDRLGEISWGQGHRETQRRAARAGARQPALLPLAVLAATPLATWSGALLPALLVTASSLAQTQAGQSGPSQECPCRRVCAPSPRASDS